MNGLPRHPGIEEIAEFQAKVADGTRGDLVAEHLAACPDCRSVGARLERVPQILASVPQPALPVNVEARILAALTAESQARIASSGRNAASLDAPDQVADFAIRRDPAGASSGGRPPGPPVWRRRTLVAPLGVLVAAAACLVLAFVGLRLSDQGHPGGASAAGGGHPARASGRPSVGGGVMAGPRQDSRSPALRQQAPFSVLVSTVNFQSSTLRSQVRHQLAVGPGADDQVAPSKSLVSCVARLTGGARLSLVEEARYESRPAYVIVIPARAWAVARTCTSADPAVLASAALSAGR